MILVQIFVSAIIVAYLGVVDATKGISSRGRRTNELDTVTPLTPKESKLLVTLFDRGIFKYSGTEEKLRHRRLASRKSKKSSGSSNSRKSAHKLEYTKT